MAEAIALASGVAGLLSLAIQITTISHRYISGFKGASKAVQSLFRELSALQKVLIQLQDIAQNPEYEEFTVHLQASVGIAECHQELDRIRQKLQKRKADGAVSASLNRLTWPFVEDETQRLVEVLYRYQVTFTSSLFLDTFQTTMDTSKQVKSLCDNEIESTQRKILKWLSTVDSTSNQSAARLKHEPETGNWLLESESFKNWLNGEKQFLWIHGIPGSGKTVLCSTLINHVQRNQETDVRGLAYFYFDFKDSDKQVLDRFLRSIVAQLSRQLSSFPTVLQDFYRQYEAQNEHLPDTELTKVLTSILSQFQSSTIVIDALDECREQREVMEKLALLIGESCINTRILVTSRKERDIELGLKTMITDQVALQGSVVKNDINLHVRRCLSQDPVLSLRPDSVKEKIESALVDGARGMFRWVACQLVTLRSCKTLSSLETALKSLPKTLDATYDRILTSIDPENQLIARTALEWLCFSYRPLQLSELVEVVGLKPRSYPLEFPDRLFEPEDLFSICSSLISTSKSARDSRTPVVQLAHYSIQEYLVSERIRTGPAKAFALEERSSKSAMAEKYLTYLLGFRNPDSLYHGVGIDYPYLEYASRYWVKHMESALEHPGSVGSGLSDLVREFSNYSKHDAFLNSRRISTNETWDDNSIQLYTLKDAREPIVFHVERNSLGTPLFDAAENGAILLCKFLLENGADVNEVCGTINAGRPLTIAARKGHIDIVRLFLDANATLDVEGSYSPLAQAASYGRDAIVQLLVEAGACINPPEGTDSLNVPLLRAARFGHLAIVETLIRFGADIHWKDDLGESALHVAAISAHRDCKDLSRKKCGEQLMQIFLDGGLDINAESRFFGTPLTAAIHGYNKIEVKLLLERGADAGMKTSGFGKPLELARREYHKIKKDTSSWRLEESKRIKKMLKYHLKARGEAAEDSDSDYNESRKWWPKELDW